METTAGSLALVGAPTPADATLVSTIASAGAVILGKTNLSEWANFRSTHSTSGWSARGGLTRNPYALDRNPCGSSSGSGVAVAANLCDACSWDGNRRIGSLPVLNERHRRNQADAWSYQSDRHYPDRPESRYSRTDGAYGSRRSGPVKRYGRLIHRRPTPITHNFSIRTDCAAHASGIARQYFNIGATVTAVMQRIDRSDEESRS